MPRARSQAAGEGAHSQGLVRAWRALLRASRAATQELLGRLGVRVLAPPAQEVAGQFREGFDLTESPP